MGFDTDLVAGFAQLLAAADIGLDWHPDGTPYTSGIGIYDSDVPPSPDDVVTLTAYGLGDGPTYADSTRGLQIRVRSAGADPRVSRDMDDAIADVLIGLYPMTLPTGIYVKTLERTSSTPLGQDDNRRWSRSSNYALGLWRPSQHRL